MINKILESNSNDLEWIVQGKQFKYHGFVGNWEEDRYQLYTDDEWGYGSEFRTPEMSRGNVTDSLIAIDNYWKDIEDNRFAILDNDIEDSSEVEYEDIQDTKDNESNKVTVNNSSKDDPNNIVNKNKDKPNEINVNVDNKDDSTTKISSDNNLDNPTNSKQLIF